MARCYVTLHQAHKCEKSIPSSVPNCSSRTKIHGLFTYTLTDSSEHPHRQRPTPIPHHQKHPPQEDRASNQHPYSDPMVNGVHVPFGPFVTPLSKYQTLGNGPPFGSEFAGSGTSHKLFTEAPPGKEHCKRPVRVFLKQLKGLNPLPGVSPGAKNFTGWPAEPYAIQFGVGKLMNCRLQVLVKPKEVAKSREARKVTPTAPGIAREFQPAYWSLLALLNILKLATAVEVVGGEVSVTVVDARVC